MKGPHRESKKIQLQILLRDFGQEDGDFVRILVNDEEVLPKLMLKNKFFILTLPLKEGFNKIEFQALNQGTLYPNTAELRMYDDHGTPLAIHNWNLSDEYPIQFFYYNQIP